MRIGLRRAAAAAGVATVAAVAWVPAAAPAAAVAPTHVAIVVAGDRSACVGWHSGMTGADVLTNGGFSTNYASSGPYAGLLLRIDGYPAQPDVKNDYWSYWQNTGSGWVYAQQGPTSSQPQPGSVEGWSYVSTSTTPANAPRPPAQSYATICAGQDYVPPQGTSPARPSHPASSTAASPSAGPPGPSASVTGTAAQRSRSTRSASATSANRRTAAHVAGVATPSAPTSRSGGTGPPTSSSPVAARRSSPSALPTVGTVAALVVVAALGAGGYLNSRRHRP